MKLSEVQVGGIYSAKVSGRIVPVRVTNLREAMGFRAGKPVDVTRIDCVNTVTGRSLSFRSAARLRRKVG